MAIQIIKLVTGEDIVGEVSTVKEGIKIERPLKLAILPNPDKVGSFRLAVEPWAPYCKDGEVLILKGNIFATFYPDDTIVGEYEKSVDFRPTQREVLNEEKEALQ